MSHSQSLINTMNHYHCRSFHIEYSLEPYSIPKPLGCFYEATCAALQPSSQDTVLRSWCFLESLPAESLPAESLPTGICYEQHVLLALWLLQFCLSRNLEGSWGSPQALPPRLLERVQQGPQGLFHSRLSATSPGEWGPCRGGAAYNIVFREGKWETSRRAFHLNHMAMHIFWVFTCTAASEDF